MWSRFCHICLVAIVLIHSVSSLTVPVQSTRGRRALGAYHFPSSTNAQNVNCLDLKRNGIPHEMKLSLSNSSTQGQYNDGSNMSRVKAFFTKVGSIFFSHFKVTLKVQTIYLLLINTPFFLRQCGMVSYVASMCVALPISLLPPVLLHRIKLISTTRKEHLSLRAGQFCSRWLLRVFPFASVKVMKHAGEGTPEPSIWVCNHTSMLDIFVLLAADKKLRGKKKRPIKIIYWKELERNPITRILFKNCGFIPVEMEDNGNGNANSYNKGSFKIMLKNIKKAFEDGFE